MPNLRNYQAGLWVLFALSLPMGLYTNWLAFAALVLGMIKRHGMIQFNKLYLQRVMFDENFQNIPYLGVLSMVGGLSFILYLPLLIHAYLESAPILK